MPRPVPDPSLPPFERLVALIDALREPDGCPWDREQTPETIKPYTLEEAYEVAEAIDRKDRAALREELGDLLLQVVILARMGKEEGAFTVDDVATGITEKLIRRHPHVFGETEAKSADQVVVNWEKIKDRERRDKAAVEEEPSMLGGIPRALPALLKAYRIGEKAGRVGFDWDHPEQVLGKIEEELGELRVALASPEGADAARERVADEYGDLLFALANLARKLRVDPEECLQRTNRKFMERFAHIERRLRQQGRTLEDATLEEMEGYWQEAKSR